MTNLELKLSLPDRLAQEAQAAGLLTPEAIESMLRETLRRQHVEELAEGQLGRSCDPLAQQVPQVATGACGPALELPGVYPDPQEARTRR